MEKNLPNVVVDQLLEQFLSDSLERPSTYLQDLTHPMSELLLLLRDPLTVTIINFELIKSFWLLHTDLKIQIEQK